jgi:hypothetical protein
MSTKIREKLVGELEIFNSIRINIVPEKFLHGYYTNKDYTDLHISFFENLKEKFDYIGFAFVSNYGFNVFQDGDLLKRINNSYLDIDIERIEPFKSELHFKGFFNGYGEDLDIMNQHELEMELTILGKVKGSQLPLWKELLFSFYYLYETANFRAAFIQLFSCLEAYLEFMGAEDGNIEEKVKNLVSVSLLSREYENNLHRMRLKRNKLVHGTVEIVRKRDVKEFFDFFCATYRLSN